MTDGLPLCFSVLRAVDDRNDDNFAALLVNLVNNDVRPFDELPRAFNETEAAHVHEFR
jgi:hypothetical protein